MSGDIFAPHGCLQLDGRYDIDSLFEVIAALPRPATIFVEGTSIEADVEAFLAQRAVTPTRDDLSGIIAPRPRQFHVRLDDDVVDGLRDLANRHAEPEMFDHLAVYAGDHVLLAAYDVGLDPICMSRALPAPVQRRIFEIVAT